MYDYTPADVTRFWSYVDKDSSPDGCWLWTGSVSRRGYGKFTGHQYVAHRALRMPSL